MKNLKKTMELLDKIILLCGGLDIDFIRDFETKEKEKAVEILYNLQSKIDNIIRQLSKLRNEILERRIKLENER